MVSERFTIFWHGDVLGHDTGHGVFEAPPSPLLARQMPHPENAERILNMKRALEVGPVASRVRWASGRHASDGEILTVHEPAYLDRLKAADGQDVHRFSATTVFAPGSLAAIRAAAGTTLAALEAILAGETEMAHALVRPPGHHAQPAMADGYCFLNNAALAAAAARARGLERIAVIDWDVHHGNGTQACFYERPDVLTISLHMDHGAWGPTHPQTGRPDERGSRAGEGFNVNINLPFGVGDEAYVRAFDEIVGPRVEAFAPELVIVANGQDASQFDPNGRQLVTMNGFHEFARRTGAMARRYADGRLLSVQEGGYNPAYAALCLHATIEGFLDVPPSTPDPLAYMPEDVEAGRRAVERIRDELQGTGLPTGGDQR